MPWRVVGGLDVGTIRSIRRQFEGAEVLAMPVFTNVVVWFSLPRGYLEALRRIVRVA